MATQLEKCKTFAAMHGEQQAWVIPNPWDLGSARVLQGLGFRALATTSSGLAFSLGTGDGQVSLDQKLAHCSALCAGTSIPVNADFENGYSDDIRCMQDNILRLIETGVAGLSIEDFSRDTQQVYGTSQAEERVGAAAEAIKGSGVPVLLTARAENLIRGRDDLEDTLARLQAYQQAGADVLYAPGVSTLDDLARVCSALDKPFNALASLLPGATLQQMSDAGATRVSVGGALTWASLAPLLAAGKEMQEHGSFDWLEGMVDAGELRSLMAG